MSDIDVPPTVALLSAQDGAWRPEWSSREWRPFLQHCLMTWQPGTPIVLAMQQTSLGDFLRETADMSVRLYNCLAHFISFNGPFEQSISLWDAWNTRVSSHASPTRREKRIGLHSFHNMGRKTSAEWAWYILRWYRLQQDRQELTP